jgi:hypothetical protein
MQGVAVSKNDPIEPTETYVLEETEITKSRTIEELAEMAAGSDTPKDDEGLDFDSLDSPGDSDE